MHLSSFERIVKKAPASVHQQCHLEKGGSAVERRSFNATFSKEPVISWSDLHQNNAILYLLTWNIMLVMSFVTSLMFSHLSKLVQAFQLSIVTLHWCCLISNLLQLMLEVTCLLLSCISCHFHSGLPSCVSLRHCQCLRKGHKAVRQADRVNGKTIEPFGGRGFFTRTGRATDL